MRATAAPTGVKMVDEIAAELGDPKLDELIGADNHRPAGPTTLSCWTGAAEEFDLEAVQKRYPVARCSSVRR